LVKIAKKLTIDSINIYVKKNSSCELLSTEYLNIKTKLIFKCNCNNIFTTTFNRFKFKNKRQCDECGKKIYINKRTKSHANLLSGKKCNVCSKNKKLTNKEFANKIKQLVGNEYIFLENYINIKTPIKVKHNCKDCNYNEYYVTPNNFLKNKRCNVCAIKKRVLKRTKTHEQYLSQVFDLVEDEYLIIGEYINDRTKIKIKHNKCQYIYDVQAGMFLQGNRCPKCNFSKGENKVLQFLIKNNIEFETQKKFKNCKNQRQLLFDFYLPKKNILIEYDGKFHFIPGGYSKDKNKMQEKLKKQQKNDNIKNHYCFKHNIKLVRIHYKNFDNIEEILKTQIL